MTPTMKIARREQSRGEEISNSASHGIALLLVVISCPWLFLQASRQGDFIYLLGVAIFAISMMMQYASSSIYHALPAGRAKQILRRIEHSAIFLLIAGTYTPFTLGVLRGSWGWTLFALVWTLAIAGVVLKSSNRLFHPLLSNTLFLVMGWLVVVAVKPMLAAVPFEGLMLIVAGGLSYTIGVVFYSLSSRVRYTHFIWHLFVMAGSSFHYFAVLWYAA